MCRRRERRDGRRTHDAAEEDVMKSRPIAALTALAASLALMTGPALAHHSFAMFDRSKEVRLEGTVKEFSWTNPHSWIEIAVPNAGGDPVTWAIEMTSPNNLVGDGWKRTTLQPGDKVVLFVYPLKSGEPGGSFVAVRLADGKFLGTGAPRN
jgi:hypothetical protein